MEETSMRILLLVIITMISYPLFATDYECFRGVRDEFHGDMNHLVSSDNYIICNEIPKNQNNKK